MKKSLKRVMMSTATAALLSGSLTGCTNCLLSSGEVVELKTGDFYEKDSLSVEKVKAAYFEMMKRFNYPIPDILLTENFWACDFAQEDILALGMGGIFWINQNGQYKESGAKKYKGTFGDENFGYLLHEIYLLPGQTLPEHRHVGGEMECGPKMESWQVRYGSVGFYGQYKHNDEVLIKTLPKEKQPWGFGEDWFQSTYIAHRDCKTNQMYTLLDPESWHGQMAGPEGAIVTEVATFHNHVEFSKPGMAFKNSGSK